MADGRAISSPINAKLGGRPKLEATKLREALIRQMEAKADILAEALIEKALNTRSKGDVPALKEVLDRGLGKVVQGLDHTTDGKEMPVPILSVLFNPPSHDLESSGEEKAS